eukprot:CAMPEP_0180649780 /NCGR_PEP_ID=MMETSP1037_2-20121125/51803_1 /TAXON_ID=632150 /ORGANISM="Azadinium spinosum, Strain 3D9" /LENGTH=84 /DNA_ID=CAMNT_0022674923 /DNA_START=46 /DNA_END=297 /DNA_ORIENTATION=-
MPLGSMAIKDTVKREHSLDFQHKEAILVGYTGLQSLLAGQAHALLVRVECTSLMAGGLLRLGVHPVHSRVCHRTDAELGVAAVT